MTPKEKAVSLIGLFNRHCKTYPDKFESSKEVSIICVNQIISVLKETDIRECKYWKQVKQEIKNV